MQEKDIIKKMNRELEEMAPDLVEKICSKPIEPIKSEKELLGKDRHLFREKKNISKIFRYAWMPALIEVVFCLVFVITFLNPGIIPKDTKTAFSIVIDVNPSVSINVKADGTVKSIKAGNRDGRAIVKQINSKMGKNTDYNKAVRMVVSGLNEEGYLKKKKNAMLLSVVSEDPDHGKETLRAIKENTKSYKDKKGINCTTVYQNCVRNKKIEKVAKKNNVSIGKAAFCIRLAEKENTSVKKMCRKNIDSLVTKVEKSGTEIFEEIEIDGYDMNDETESFMPESITGQTETVEEITTAEESSESESENVSAEDQPDYHDQEKPTGETLSID